ncbi:MAG: BsaA family SipW-dependent biofilm matrix protein [Anaerovoracaceae bacterium]
MKNNRKLIIISGLVALLLMSGTLAFFSSTMAVNNVFGNGTGQYGSKTIEKFTPKDNWTSGETVTKEVSVVNTGDYNLWARVKFSESWSRNGKPISGYSYNSGEPGFTNASPVIKNLNETEWTLGGDGFYYLNKKLTPGKTSSPVLRSITLNNGIDMGSHVNKLYYTKAKARPAADNVGTDPNSQWVAVKEIPEGSTFYKNVSEVDENNGGLSGAEYTLVVESQVSQATSQAGDALNWLIRP